MPEIYKIEFKDEQNNIIFSGDTNEMTQTFEIPAGSSGDTDLRKYPDYSVDPTGETKIDAYVYRYVGMPVLATQNFVRLSTEDKYNNAMLTDEQNGIRIGFTLTHSGNTHTVRFSYFEKYCGRDGNNQDVWVGLWSATSSSVGGYWDSSQGQDEEGYFAFYRGTVTGQTAASADKECIGFQFVTHRQGQFYAMSPVMFWEKNVFEPIYDYSGSYLPTTGNITIGGRGDGSYPSDPAERPDVDALNLYLSFGSSNGKGLTYYSVLVPDVYAVFSKIYGNSYINLETRLKSMIDFFRIPFVSTAGSNIRMIPVADVEVDLGENHGMAPITARFVEVDFGVFSLANYGWDDFNDFKNTRASLYLPFHGRVSIDINAIARGSIEVVAVCDAYTGNITYWVYTTSMQAPREVLYGVYEGQSAVQIPVANTYNPNQMGKIISVGASLGGAVAAGVTYNPMLAMASAVALSKSLTSGEERSVDRSHAQDTASSATSPLHIRLDIERREMLRTELYREYAGIPAFTTQKLKDLEGFVRIHSADYDGLKCAQSEKETIKAMLEEGVYI